MSRLRLIIITGLSGSGKSTAARALEDEGFFVVDNLPLALLPNLLELSETVRAGNHNVAVVVDVRNLEFLGGYEEILEEVRARGHRVEVYFFDAADEILLRRYSETRRRHPLAQKEGILQGISRERDLLAGLRNQASVIIDSSWHSPHQLRTRVLQTALGQQEMLPLVVRLQSFGFRYGIPPGSDVVMDVRFLPNPHFIPQLRPMTGLELPVKDFLAQQPTYRTFVLSFQDLFAFLLPEYRKEGKSYLTVSIGCTGGRHRSVAVVEELRQFFMQDGISLEVQHRDKDKE